MIELIKTHPVFVVISAFVLGAVIVAIVWGCVASIGSRSPSAAVPSSHRTTSAPSTTPAPTTAPEASASGSDGCPRATVTVASASELSSALAGARAGAVIVMAEGRYSGNFTATSSGTPGTLITLCGSAGAVLDGGSTDSGYVFHLDHASYWHLIGFSVTDGQKGVMADGTIGSVIERLTVSHIGDEAIHLRDNSTDNVVTGNTVSDTGHRKPQFGEGIYIGTANSNWCSVSNCRPDNSDRNLIEGNTVSGTSAENVDIKEGTTGGILRDNRFNGQGMTAADSWVDVKGNDWTIQGNTGQNSPADGFQVHNVSKGWGTGNVFRSNAAAVNGPGYGIHLAPVQANVVLCSNTASGAGRGLSNVRCTSG
jgi:Right handed beta helix region